MSLVNRMLKELAERQQGPGFGMEGVRVVAAPARPPAGRKALYFALPVVVLAGALIASGMPWPRSLERVAVTVRAATGTDAERSETLVAERSDTVIVHAAAASDMASAPAATLITPAPEAASSPPTATAPLPLSAAPPAATAAAAAVYSDPTLRAVATPVPPAPAASTTPTGQAPAAPAPVPSGADRALGPDTRPVAAASSAAPANRAAAEPPTVLESDSGVAMASAAGLAVSPPPADTGRTAQERPEESGEVTADPPSAVQRERPAEPDAETLYHRGGAHLQRGELTAAEADYRKVLALDPAHRFAREALCALLLDQGRLQDAAGLLEEGLVTTPGYLAFRRMQARILVAHHSPDQAVAMLEQTPPAVAVDPEYHALLAALYLRLGQDEKAVNAYQALVRLRPDEAAWWAGLGAALEARHEPAQALQAYRRAQQTGRLKDTLLAFVNERRTALER